MEWSEWLKCGRKGRRPDAKMTGRTVSATDRGAATTNGHEWPVDDREKEMETLTKRPWNERKKNDRTAGSLETEKELEHTEKKVQSIEEKAQNRGRRRRRTEENKKKQMKRGEKGRQVGKRENKKLKEMMMKKKKQLLKKKTIKKRRKREGYIRESFRNLRAFTQIL